MRIRVLAIVMLRYLSPFARKPRLINSNGLDSNCFSSQVGRIEDMSYHVIEYVVDGFLCRVRRWRRRLTMFDETSFLRPSWPLEYVKINSNYANPKPTWDIIFWAIVIFAKLVTVYEKIKFNLSKWTVFKSVAFKT